MREAVRTLLDSLAKRRETNWRFAAAVTLAHGALVTYLHVHHEFWRDEIHSWSIARLATGFGDLLTGDRVYEGHPPGWFWYLRLFTFITHKSWGLHAATVSAVVAATALFARFAPLPRLIKVLLLSSYLFAFEYTVMSRNYALGWFFLTVACTLYHPLEPRPVLIPFVLGLLSLSSAYGAILACCLFPVAVNASYSVRISRSSPRKWIVISPALVIGTLLFGAMVVATYTTSSPPDPNPYSGDWTFSALTPKEVIPSLERVLYAFMPVRATDASAWLDMKYFWSAHDVLRPVAAVGLTIALLIALAPSWLHVASFATGIGLMGVLQVARFRGEVRHWGHAVILFVALLWLSRAGRPRQPIAAAVAVLIVASVFQLQSALAIARMEVALPFSGGNEAASFIKRSGLSRMPLVAGPEMYTITVTGLLRKEYISSETEEINQTVVFHSRRLRFRTHLLVERAALEVRKTGAAVLVLSNQELPRPKGTLPMKLLFSSGKKILVDKERFFVYRLGP